VSGASCSRQAEGLRLSPGDRDVLPGRHPGDGRLEPCPGYWAGICFAYATRYAIFRDHFRFSDGNRAFGGAGSGADPRAPSRDPEAIVVWSRSGPPAVAGSDRRAFIRRGAWDPWKGDRIVGAWVGIVLPGNDGRGTPSSSRL